jgi:hypothetical protein
MFDHINIFGTEHRWKRGRGSNGSAATRSQTFGRRASIVQRDVDKGFDKQEFG